MELRWQETVVCIYWRSLGQEMMLQSSHEVYRIKLTSVFLYRVCWWVPHWDFFVCFSLIDLGFCDLSAFSPSPFQQYCQSPWTKGIVTVNHKQVGGSGTSRPAFVHILSGGWKVFSKVPKLFVAFLSDMKNFRDIAKYSHLSPVPSVCCHYLE